MGYCKKCGWELNTGANFCPNCGEPTSESSVARQEVKAAIKSQARKTSTAGNTKVAHKRKKKAPIRYGTWEKVALVIGGCLLVVSLFSIGMDSFLIFGVNILGCLSMLYAIVTILLRKSEITNQGAQVLAIVSLLFFPVMKGMEYLSVEENENKIEQVSNSEVEIVESPAPDKTDSKKAENVAKEFFEDGYKYSASFRVSRKEGYGISCNYKYVIRLYNDGTKEISVANQTDNGSPTTQGTNPCEIRKKNESYKDVSAKWYEVSYSSGGTVGGRYSVSSERIYVDENGNIYVLYQNGSNKTIQEAISTKDCIFGKFSKEKMTKESYRCKTCGEEYDPTKEPIYNEEYCYQDLPLTCKKCGKRYTVRQEGVGAMKELCSSCYNKWQAARNIGHATSGR